MADVVTNVSGFSLDTGPIVDQTPVGGSAAGTPSLFIGGSDYSTVFNTAGNTQITLNPNTDYTFNLTSVGFGQTNFTTDTPPLPSEGFYQSLGYPNQPQAAYIQYNAVGLGLPSFLWYQLTNLLYKVDTQIASDLTCDNSVGGACYLTNACSTYTNLW